MNRVLGPDPYEWLVRSRIYLAEHYSERVTLEIAAQEACLSPFHFHRRFQTAFGETPHEFLTRLRLEQAKSLLRKSDLTVSEICLAVGYESLGTFSSSFARKTGQAPTEFRRLFSVPEIWALKVVPHCYLRFRRANPREVLLTNGKIGETPAARGDDNLLLP